VDEQEDKCSNNNNNTGSSKVGKNNNNYTKLKAGLESSSECGSTAKENPKQINTKKFRLKDDVSCTAGRDKSVRGDRPRNGL
jgi:hypothetical protein